MTDLSCSKQNTVPTSFPSFHHYKSYLFQYIETGHDKYLNLTEFHFLK